MLHRPPPDKTIRAMIDDVLFPEFDRTEFVVGNIVALCCAGFWIMVFAVAFNHLPAWLWAWLR